MGNYPRAGFKNRLTENNERSAVIKSGIGSVAMRTEKAGKIIALAGKAGFDGIEWGGDAHVPHGKLIYGPRNTASDN